MHLNKQISNCSSGNLATTATTDSKLRNTDGHKKVLNKERAKGKSVQLIRAS
jgi:hypothetical protein